MSLLGLSSAGHFGDESVEGVPSIYPIDVTLDSQTYTTKLTNTHEVITVSNDLDVKQVNTYNIQLIEK